LWASQRASRIATNGSAGSDRIERLSRRPLRRHRLIPAESSRFGVDPGQNRVVSSSESCGLVVEITGKPSKYGCFIGCCVLVKTSRVARCAGRQRREAHTGWCCAGVGCGPPERAAWRAGAARRRARRAGAARWRAARAGARGSSAAGWCACAGSAGCPVMRLAVCTKAQGGARRRGVAVSTCLQHRD